MSAYENVIGGKLKLKGKALDVKAGGVKKKKKKHKKQEEQALKITEHDLIEGESTEALGQLIEGEEEGEEAGRIENLREDVNLQQDDDELLTPAERRYIEQKQRLDVQKLAKEANKSHRNRIEDFNQYLANMSEHYDIPKVGPG
ncbi:PREDICTED: protein FAM32A-like [Camelina sativa]|uniref:Protein FAM32A-like n=1 Tax=Camelina sativa TaxID=90675 RepID=A0ABM0YA69_CAMSA|nr:PREDICTED: protein FAM32A-like [Camelina sativa]XP_010498011.1 PREDICTED: protein FAM32A-like [Camelina sativa]